MKRRSGTKRAPPPDPTFFVDRSLGRHIFPGRLRQAGLSVVHHDACFPETATDVEWLELVGDQGWVALTCDERIGRNRYEREMLMAYQVRAIFIVARRATAAQRADLVIHHYARIRRFVARHSPPFIAKLYDRKKQPLVRWHPPA